VVTFAVHLLIHVIVIDSIEITIKVGHTYAINFPQGWDIETDALKDCKVSSNKSYSASMDLTPWPRL
jgi:hypothetical protein